MNSRPGFSIRRLISQRRPRCAEDGCGGDSVNEGFVQEGRRRPSKDYLSGSSSSQSNQNARTWNRTKSPPKPILVVSGSSAAHMISGPLPPLPDTPLSAASSLCSCDFRASPRTPASASTLPSLCHSRSKTPDTLSPLLSPRAMKLDEMGLLLQDRPDSAVPLALVQTLSPVSDKTGQNASPQNQTVADQQAVEDMSENIRQLIRETDEAFKAVGTALSEARLASQTSPSTSLRLARDSEFSAAMALSPRWTASRAGSKSPLRITAPLASPTRRASVSKTKRRKSKKGRRPQQQQESHQQQEQKQQLRDTQAATPKHGARWTVTENMSELLNSRLFNRLQVDEIQTPDQVQEWRRKNRPPTPEVNMSTETLRTVETDGSDTPVEPFHLEDLPSRIGAAGVRLSMVPSPTVDVENAAAFDFGLEVVRKDFSLEQQQQPLQQQLPSLPKSKSAEAAMTFQNVSFPAPPMKIPMRQQPRRQLPPLPTIPEVTVTGPYGSLKRNQQPQTQKPQQQKQQKRQAQVARTQQMQEMRQAKVTDEFVMLHCSPFTMTMPTFRHGPIRFSRTELNVLDPKALAADETLDWTAYQMAILGGAGDFLSDSVDFTRMAESDEADELANWFEEFGVGSIGHLASSEEQEREIGREAEVRTKQARSIRMNEKARRFQDQEDRQRQQEQTSKDDEENDDDDDDSTERAGSVAENRQMPPALDTELASKCPPSPAATADYSPISSTGSSSASTQPEMVQIHRGLPPIPLVLERPPGLWNPKFEFAGQGIRRWVLEAQQQPEGPSKERSASHDSLPQSPMLDLVVSRSVAGEDYVVPMGYNLGHDLGDFLKWESENAHASGYFG